MTHARRHASCPLQRDRGGGGTRPGHRHDRDDRRRQTRLPGRYRALGRRCRGDGLWSTASNWSSGPGAPATDVVCIDAGAGTTIGKDVSVAVLALETTQPLAIHGHLTLTDTTQASQIGADTFLDAAAGTPLSMLPGRS